MAAKRVKLQDPLKAGELALSVLRGQTAPSAQKKAQDLLDAALDQLLGGEPGKEA